MQAKSPWQICMAITVLAVWTAAGAAYSVVGVASRHIRGATNLHPLDVSSAPERTPTSGTARRLGVGQWCPGVKRWWGRKMWTTWRQRTHEKQKVKYVTRQILSVIENMEKWCFKYFAPLNELINLLILFTDTENWQPCEFKWTFLIWK